MSTETELALREQVRRHYAAAAEIVTAGCGGGTCCGEPTTGDDAAALYDPAQLDEVPPDAIRAALGCGNPTAVAEIAEGDVVLDLGSGGGIDVILTSRRTGPSGTVYGLDMTDEMLALARRNIREAGVQNAHLLKGVMEEIPLPAESVDVVISNCVVNLSPDKAAVLAEVSRVLKPGGRLGISDIVAEDRLTPAERARRGSHVGCIAGALSRGEFVAGLEAAGFEEIEVTFTHEVADGLHGAIVKGRKTADPVAKGLPLVQPAVAAGCC
jgi:arsenite methyltransferase